MGTPKLPKNSRQPKKQTEKQNDTTDLSATTPPLRCAILFFFVFSRFCSFWSKNQKNLEKTNKNKIVHFKGWVVTESWGVQFCLVCFLINNLIMRFTSFQNCTCLLSMKAMLLSKEENIIWFEWRTVSLKQVEPKKKLVVRLMLSSKDVCQRKMADTEESVYTRKAKAKAFWKRMVWKRSGWW